jgi:4-hydroxythreonine-4-phosphate dehydrogenase
MKHVPRWAIVADDLSGAADAGAGFLGAGQRVVVTWGERDFLNGMPAADVLAVDTRSRRGTPERARSVTFAAVEALRAEGVARLFTKIDSTLRGHVGELVAASRDAWGRDALALVAPAFPAVGRTTREGRQLVNGQPLFSAAPIGDMLDTIGLKSSHVDVSAMRGANAAGLLEARYRSGDRAVVCDAETDADLRAIVQAGSALDVPVVWVGSGGLTRHLDPGPGPGGEAPANAHFAGFSEPIARGAVLIVVGSATDLAHRQAAALASHGAIYVSVPAADLLADAPNQVLDERLHRILLHLEAARDVVVTIADGVGIGEEPRLVARLAVMLKAASRSAAGLVVTGGETAMHLFQSWGITGLRLFDEVETGMPRSWTVGRVGLPVVTKSGGFGDDLSLERARRRLRAEGPAVQREGDAVWRSQ